MGAWDVSVFANDDALDWVYELEESDNVFLLVQTLRVIDDVDESDYVDAPDCVNALAAAEVVAALIRAGGTDLPDEVTEWVDAHKHLNATPHVPLALRVVARIRAGSELKELWEESDDYLEWDAVIAELESRLRGGLASQE